MRFIVALIAAGLATGASAQTAQTSPHNPAVKDSNVHAVAAPVKGHSSFTEAQAKGRIAKAGFSNVGKLTKTDAGFWQGPASKDGRTVTVTLDYKGNVSAN